MGNGGSSDGGRLSLGDRVKQLEHKVAQLTKQAKISSLHTDEFSSLVGKRVEVFTNQSLAHGTLDAVGKYTITLRKTGGRVEVYNKGQVIKVRMAG